MIDRRTAFLGPLARAVLLAAAALLTAGCSRLDVRIKLNADGSATIIERMTFSRTQLEQEVSLPGGPRLKDFLTKGRALKRAERMGAGCKLVRHQVRKTADAGMEATAVYTIPDINDLRYLPPFFAAPAQPASALRIEVGPSYAPRHASPDRPGHMYVQFSMQQAGKKPGAAAPARAAVKATPAELQALRELAPVAKDLLKDSRIRITFEAYDTFWYGSYQYFYKLTVPGTQSPTNKYYLINCSGADLDALGKNILDNQEVMLELLRGDYAGESIERHAGWGRGRGNPRAPTFYAPDLTWRTCRLRFAPSDYHRKKYFDGKLVSQGGNVKDQD